MITYINKTMNKIIIIIIMMLCSININAQFKTETIATDSGTVVINKTTTIKEKVYWFENNDPKTMLQCNLIFYFVNNSDSTYTSLTIEDNKGTLLYEGNGYNFELYKVVIYNSGALVYSIKDDDGDTVFCILYIPDKKTWVLSTKEL